MPLSILQCPYCPKTSSRGTGLASHIRGSHPASYPAWVKSRKLGGPAAAVAVKPATTGAVSGFGDIVARLEQQKKAIEVALEALRGIEEVAEPAVTAASAPQTRARKKRRGGMSSEGKARLIEALKRRWAKQKAAQAAAPATKEAGRKTRRPKKS